MPNIDEADEIEIESRTQSPEAITAILEGDDYAVTSKVQATDGTEKPAEEAGEKPVEKPGEAAKPEAEETSEKPPATEATDEAETDDEAEPADTATPEHKKLSGAARAKLKRQQLADENESLKRQLAELKAGQPKAEPARPAAEVPKPEVAPEDEKPKPKPSADDFEDGLLDAAYQEALVDWKLEERERQARVKAAETAKAQATERRSEDEKARRETWNAHITAAKAKHDDYDAVMASANDLPISMPVHVAVQDSPQPAEVLYWLASHPEETRRIAEATTVNATDSPRVQARKTALAVEEVEKIEAALAEPAPKTTTEQPAQAAGAPEKPPVPKKPAPVEPVGARGGGSRKPLSQYTDQELLALDSPEYIRLYRAEYGRNPY